MKQTLIEDGGLLPADAQAAKVLHPANGAFNGPAAGVASQRSAVLRDILRLPIGSVWSNHLDALPGHFLVQSIAVVRPVTDDPLRHRFGQHEVKQPLGQAALVRGRRAGGHRP